MYIFHTPLTLPCGLTLRNRIIRAAAFAGGNIEEIADTHAEVAQGGVALTTIAYTSVSNDGRTFPQQICLTKESLPSNIHIIAERVHANGGLLSYQLTHAGGFATASIIDRSMYNPMDYSSPITTDNGKPLAPSSVFELTTLSYPTEITVGDMDRLCQDFVQAAVLACTQGQADAVEVHLGHGYLLSQWLCPLTNQRNDEHGGTALNRIKFPLRILQAIRKAIGPAKAIFVKINLDDGFTGGVTPDDVDTYVRTLIKEPLLIDGIIPSAGFVSKNGFYMLRGSIPRLRMVKALAQTSAAKAAAFAVLGKLLVPELPFEPKFLLDGSKRIYNLVKSSSSATNTLPPVFTVGGYVNLPDVEEVLQYGFSGVQMARALIREPNLVKLWMKELDLFANESSGSGSRISSTEEKREKNLSGGDKMIIPLSLNDDRFRSPCTHCNVCVLGALTPELPSRCIEREKVITPPKNSSTI